MSTASSSALEQIIRESGEDWLIDWFQPPERALDHIRDTLATVTRVAEERLGADAPRLSEETLAAEYQQNPHRVRAFLQALGGQRSPQMLLMVWRILQGMEVKQLQVQFQRQQEFQLRVVLESPYGEEDAPYVSDSILDFALLRQLGMQEAGGAPAFDGFYPLRVRE